MHLFKPHHLHLLLLCVAFLPLTTAPDPTAGPLRDTKTLTTRNGQVRMATKRIHTIIFSGEGFIRVYVNGVFQGFTQTHFSVKSVNAFMGVGDVVAIDVEGEGSYFGFIAILPTELTATGNEGWRAILADKYDGPSGEWRRRGFDACHWPRPRVLKGRNLKSFRDSGIDRRFGAEYIWVEDAGPVHEVFARYVIGGQCGEGVGAKSPTTSPSTLPTIGCRAPPCAVPSPTSCPPAPSCTAAPSCRAAPTCRACPSRKAHECTCRPSPSRNSMLPPRGYSDATVLFVADDRAVLYINAERKAGTESCTQTGKARASLKEGDVIAFTVRDLCCLRFERPSAGIRVMITMGSAVLTSKHEGWETKRATNERVEIWANTAGGDDSWKRPITNYDTCTERSLMHLFRDRSDLDGNMPEIWSRAAPKLSTSFFRYTIQTQRGPLYATLRFTGDSDVVFYLNGVRKGSTSRCDKLETMPLRLKMHDVLAFVVMNTGDCCGYVRKGSTKFHDGSDFNLRATIETDRGMIRTSGKDWKARKEFTSSSSWMMKPYDDRSWSLASEVDASGCSSSLTSLAIPIWAKGAGNGDTVFFRYVFDGI